MTDAHDAEWRDPRNWRVAGTIYYAPRDPRVVVPKRHRWAGWTLNFARPTSWLVLALLLSVPLLLALLLPGSVRRGH